ncbi:MAG: PIN domain-containing protein [bacterium]|nr:PIN domain-containing protein [bacterium]
MDRVFLDANILFSAAYHAASGLRRLWRLKGIQLLTSGYANQEAARNLHLIVHRRRLQQLIARLELVAEAPDQRLPGRVVLPEKGRPILQAALNAGATHLLTGDKKHFGRHFGKSIASVRIATPAQYVEETASR